MLGSRTNEFVARIGALERRLDRERLFPLEWANRRVRDHFGNTVVNGPFEGVLLPEWAMTGMDLFAPKLLGIYERELHQAIESAVGRAPELAVIIGAAEGYYAAGLGRRLPKARLVAFEPRADQSQRAVEVAALNGVEVDVRVEYCTAQLLADVLGDRRGSLVICDCDGAEAEILDPCVAPGLNGAEIIVEAHDLLVAGITDRLEAVFSTTHEIDRVPTQTRYVDEFPYLDFIPLVTRQLAISEFRGAPMWWLVMRPRGTHDA
jgi:hypothetical protein